MDGSKLRKIRESKGLSQQEVADKIGVSIMAVSRWERNVSDVPFDKAALMADMFGVSLSEFSSIEYSFVVFDDSGKQRNNTVDVSGLSKSDIATVKAFVDFLRHRHGCD